MASRKILVQLDIAAASNLTSPSSGFVGFSAKADGLYQKIGTAPELRLLTSADVQNAILADGSITGAVSQAQIFTLGVKLYNLTQGYVPYASGSTKLLGNSPIYTNGTSVGIGTNNPFNKLQIMGNVGIQTSYSNGLLNFMGNSTTTLISTTRSDNTMIGNLAFDGWGSYMFSSRLGVGTNISLSNSTATLYVNGNVGIGTTNPTAKLFVAADDTHYDASLTYGNPSAFIIKNAGVELAQGVSSNWPWNYWIQSRQSSGTAWPLSLNPLGGNVGIGTPAPNQQLEITQNFRLPSTAGTTPYGIIYKDTTPFIHDFNYGNNGTVTTSGGNTFVGINAGNLTMGSTATQAYQGSYNVGLGLNSLISNTTGFYNTAVGVSSLRSNTTGYYNTANGFGSLQSNTTGYCNTANGVHTLLYNTTGYNNTANGFGSLQSNTTGYCNTANGFGSLQSNTTGYCNTALGYNSGSYLADGTTGRTTGNNGLYLGLNSKASANGTDNEIVIGYNAIGVGSNKTVLGNSSVTDTYFGSSTGSSKLWASALNLSGLTASKVVFTDGSKNLTSTGIGTASQFIKGDGSLDSNTYLTTGTAIISGSGVDGRITFWNGTNTLSSSPNLMWFNDYNTLSTYSIYLANNFRLGTSTTAGYVLTADANGNGTWQAPGGSITGSGVSGRITFWNGTNSLSSTSNLEWNNTTKNLGVTGGVVANSVSASISVSTNSLLTNSFSLIATTTAGYVLTTDANGNGTWQAPQGGGNIVSSVFGRTGTVVAVNGDYNTSQVTENTNLYFTDSRARVAISLTINGQSGASTYNNSTGILNVPNYSLTGLGGVPKTRTITINGEVQDLSANRTWNVGDLLSTGSYSNPSWLTSLAWSKITNKPTTFYGYGITETPWTSYLPLSGGTLTGDLNSKRIICQSIIGDDYNTGAIEILGSYDNTFYPTLGFNQPSKFAASIQLRGAIDFRLYAQGGTTYANLTTNKLISASLQIGTSTTSGYVLTADANGNGTWQAPTGGGVTIGAIGSVPNANGMSISGQALSLQPASALYGGVVTTGTQTLAGAKTLSSLLTASAGIVNNGSYTQTGTSANTFTGTSTFSNATYSALFTGGNVGIGTPTPLTTLDIHSLSNDSVLNVLNISNPLATTNAQNKGTAITIGLSNNTYYNKIATIYENSNPFYLNPALVFYTMNNSNLAGTEVERMRISSIGNVGIGTTDPGAYKLNVNGNTNITGNLNLSSSLSTNGFRLIATTTAGYVLTTDANGNGTWQAPTGGGGGSYVPYTGANDNVNLGSYIMYANNVILNSDARLKCNIEIIKSKNIDIDYKKYEFKSAIGDIRYGVIAQDLLKIAPELVLGSEKEGYSVKYIDLLIHEIAYLKQEIKKLTGGN